VREDGNGRRHKTFLLPVVSAIIVFLLTCAFALISEAGEEFSQPTVSDRAPAKLPTAATPLPEKTVRDDGNPAISPLPYSSANGAAPQKVDDHGKPSRLVLDENSMVSTIARKNPDGSISIEYVTGTENGARAVAERQKLEAPER
jgi:hypothetical protein